jgi:hypothetical protein
MFVFFLPLFSLLPLIIFVSVIELFLELAIWLLTQNITKQKCNWKNVI